MSTTEYTLLKDEKETLFIPLYGKALDFRSGNSILHDHTANEIVGKVGIDLSKHKRTGSKIFAVRARQYDDWVKNFITNYRNAVVVHPGCGLDARIIRVQPPDSVAWFDVDYPEVISLRKKFYFENDNYKMIATSITDPGWLKNIPADRPACIVAEGVFEYLTEEEVKILLLRMTDHFSHGLISFDVLNSSGKASANKNLEKSVKTTSILKWSVDNLDEVDRLNPKLRRTEALPLINSVFTKKLPLGFRLILNLLRLSSKNKNAMRLLRYEF